MTQIRKYGTTGRYVIVLHGGPGAAGYMAPVARGLSDRFRVLEPLQRGSGEEPLSVASHVADLHDIVRKRCRGIRPALVGHSWGAMLALAYAAAHPGDVSALALIGCGTFDPASRGRMRDQIEKRMPESLRYHIEHLMEEVSDPDERLKRVGGLTLPLYSYELVTSILEVESCDARAQQETWEDMIRLQEVGVYPAAFTSIKVPVLMLHGAADPHPGRMIHAVLQRYLPQLEYREWELCGHYPWLEKAVREEFMIELKAWLAGEPHGADS
ncbi:MAG: alpha/beta hydrolase [Acidobacteria bacterium]|nr:alpha/beta hydrolase [Acidobacteriota bacterium]